LSSGCWIIQSPSRTLTLDSTIQIYDGVQMPYRQVIRNPAACDAVQNTAVAGPGVDSGLSDLRTAKGFWHAPLSLRKRKPDSKNLANPRWFKYKPRHGLGFTDTKSTFTEVRVLTMGFSLLSKDFCFLPDENQKLHQ